MVQRRQALSLAATLGGLSPILDTLPASAGSSAAPVLVLGASGGTGLECIKYLVAKGMPCIAATRSGRFEFPLASSPLVTVAKGDVTSKESMGALINAESKLGAVIYAASASRKDEAKATSNAKAVDRDGVIACAELCIATSVPRLVLVSSGGVSKPKSAVYLFLNTVAGGIMDAKIAGEDRLRRLYAAPAVASRGVGYTVVRPGGLTRDDGLGVSAVELNQGDEKSGRIARADVAAICIESIASPDAFDTTFECYYADTAKGLNDVMASNAKAVGAGIKTQATEVASGRERRAESWPNLFKGLQRDVA